MLLTQMWYYRQRAFAALAQVEEQQRVQMEELNHRLKNNLTIVRSIVSQTSAHSSSADHLKQALLGRLDALERASTLKPRATGGRPLFARSSRIPSRRIGPMATAPTAVPTWSCRRESPQC